MAQKTVVTLTDDLDGELADETVKFGLDGVYYEIDLRESNAKKLRQLLQPYQSAARRATAPATATRGKGGRGRTSGGGDRERSAEIRAWAKKHGLPVSERGRISAILAAAFEANDPSRVKSAGSGSRA
ncbi:Lsr2 family protein [Thermopolyspora sp. NPDC052614]|uniref:histone-like nucleoid-structuring protein Lsr2 n=1 Tax=Thermopolyspora sp. NPDC052614 TaxID=3155682 RepID=UPI0034151770